MAVSFISEMSRPSDSLNLDAETGDQKVNLLNTLENFEECTVNVTSFKFLQEYYRLEDLL